MNPKTSKNLKSHFELSGGVQEAMLAPFRDDFGRFLGSLEERENFGKSYYSLKENHHFRGARGCKKQPTREQKQLAARSWLQERLGSLLGVIFG